MCGFFLLLLTGPRITMIPVVSHHSRTVGAGVQDQWVWPVLGFRFLPWTTLMFVIVAPHGSVTDLDWLWLAMAFVLDMSFSGLGVFRGRRVSYA